MAGLAIHLHAAEQQEAIHPAFCRLGSQPSGAFDVNGVKPACKSGGIFHYMDHRRKVNDGVASIQEWPPIRIDIFERRTVGAARSSNLVCSRFKCGHQRPTHKTRCAGEKNPHDGTKQNRRSTFDAKRCILFLGEKGMSRWLLKFSGGSIDSSYYATFSSAVTSPSC